jgi:RND superfamily putative drug exporter
MLITFGSLLAAGMPLITAGLGLITGIALVGLATHITDMSNVAPELAVMIGLGVGVDYALFIVTRFRENYARSGDVTGAVIEAMDTSGRAILLAGTTVVIALLGMFATGVAFMYGLAIASVLAVLLTLAASLTVLPALLSRFGERIVRPSRSARRREARGQAARESSWRRWSLTVQAHPIPLAVASLAVMLICLIPMLSMRLDSSDAGNDPSSTSTYHAFNLLSAGFGAGFNGPLLVAVELHGAQPGTALPQIRDAVAHTSDVVAVTPPRVSPSGRVAVFEAYPGSAPQAQATTDLVNRLRHQVLPPLKQKLSVNALVGGFTAGSIDFSNVLAGKLPLFIGIVVVLSALLLFVIFRSLVIPLQAGLMNLLSIGGALGATVVVFQSGFLSGVLGISKGPVEPWIPGADVRRGVRALDGLRGLPGLARARGVGSPRRGDPRGRRRDRLHRPRDHRRRGDHGLRLSLVHAGRRALDQGVRLRPGGRAVPGRAGRQMRAAAGRARVARPAHVAAAQGA